MNCFPLAKGSKHPAVLYGQEDACIYIFANCLKAEAKNEYGSVFLDVARTM